MMQPSLKNLKFLIVCLSIITWTPDAAGQNAETIQYPFANDFYQYFKQRLQKLQEQLLIKCRDSTITSYTSSDFTTTMSRKQVDMSGADFYLTADSYAYTPMKYSDLKGIVFAHQFDSDLYGSSISGHIKGLALMTDDAFVRDIHNWHPVVWIQWEDLKKSVSPNDFKLINYLYLLNARIGNVHTYNLSGDIDYEDLLFKNTFYYGTDSAFLTNCSEVLNNGRYFINLIRYNDFVKAKDSIANPAMIYSEASKDSVALYQVGLLNFKVKDKDSTFVFLDGCVSEVQQLNFNINTHQLLAFKAYTDSDHNQDGVFNIPASVYDRIPFGKDIVWLLEDYYRWLRPNYLNIPIRKK